MIAPNTTDTAPLSASLADNRRRIDQIFGGCDDIQIEPFTFGEAFASQALAVYCHPLIQHIGDNMFREALANLVHPDKQLAANITAEEVIRFFDNHGPANHLYTLYTDMEQAADAVLNGFFIIFIDSWDKALGYNVRNVNRRAISEPTTESVISGPREGMGEDLEQNIALLRVRLRTPEFKISLHTTGKHTRVRFMIGYLNDQVNREALDELHKRLSAMDRPELLDTTAIRELIEDAIYSPFPQYRVTERPDVAASALLEGKIVIMAEGSGTILIGPITFVDLFQSVEDYYQRTDIATLVRFLRIGAFFIALTLPSVYIALCNFHPELIPTNLLLTILDSHEDIPFPAFVEALLMQFFFELLREAGIRLPRPIGSAVSIVGALIIGEASIRAGVASPIMTVVIALTGIASFSLPQHELAVALRMLVFPLMGLAYLWGGFGLMIGYIFIFLHLTSLRSLGQPYMTPLGPLRPLQLLDVIVRAPLGVRRKLGRGGEAE